MDITNLIQKVETRVRCHWLAEGAYARWLWQNDGGNRKMGINEYGCADAANILYTIGRFVSRPECRAQWIETLQSQQNPETGLYFEGTHHTIHTTAHCLAALELFDAQPRYPLTGLIPYLDTNKMEAFLDGLDWGDNPWSQSHQGAGLYAALAITRTCDAAWQKSYFEWLHRHCNPQTGLGVMEHPGKAPLAHQLYGWFHYFFNHEYARQPIPYPDRLIDSCIDLYQTGSLGELFGKSVGFMEIDWVFAMNRASRQTAHRFDEVKALLWDFAQSYVAYLDGLDPETSEGLNDLHMLFGATCALAELQIALPGRITSDIPLKNVLDRRPFI
ncbi:MAG: hypothetical protein PHI98_17125 [Eubacteriales bacterium]|nr:hypothetical protein [Eubacteriales bacterium]